MKCYKHYDMDAISTCVDCGKALCPQCTEKFESPICDKCNLVRIQDDKKFLIKNSVIMIGLFILGFIFYIGDGNFFMALLGGYFFAGIPWGWSVLNKITPNIFLFLPIIGWIFYFFIKLFISLMIGMFVTPFKIYQIVKELKEANNLEEYTRQGV